jgi:uncharacterized protein (UPF0332 family)
MIHDDLLELADHLARRDPARPKQTSLRRAVATAYYAVFHALATMAPWEHFTPIYRARDHSHAKRLFEQDRNGAVFGKEVAAIGQTFILSQEQRHTADYNPDPFSLGRRETLDLIDRARQAVQATRSIPAPVRRLLAVHLIARPR